MRLLLPLLTALSLAPSAQLEQNRIQLDNGADILWILNSVFTGADPANGDYDGDLYYKVFPEAANQRCSGTWTWTGSEFSLSDDDWNTGALSYMTVLSPAEDVDGNDTLTPVFGTAGEIVLPGTPLAWEDFTGTAFDPMVDCPPPGQLSGFEIRETYLETGGSGSVDPAFVGLAQGDYAITQFFPDGQSINLPVVNSCGSSGDSSLGWAGSTDNANPMDGENQPDWTALPGASAYGGFRAGNTGAAGFVEEALDGGAHYALLVDGPAINLKVDVGLDAAPTLEVGLAALNPQVGIDGAGLPTGTSLQIGVQLYSESSKPTNNVNGIGADGIPFLGVVLIGGLAPTAPGACITSPALLIEDLGLSLSDPLLGRAIAACGTSAFADGDAENVLGVANANMDFDGNGSADDGVYNSDLIALTPSSTLVGVTISWQAFTVDSISLEARGSQVWSSPFRATN